MQKLKCPVGTSGASVGGAWYPADKAGHIEVPSECVGLLFPLGFEQVAAVDGEVVTKTVDETADDESSTPTKAEEVPAEAVEAVADEATKPATKKAK